MRATDLDHHTGHQSNLMRQFGNLDELDPDQSHQYTKSVHNQKIECFWSQLMRHYNVELINQLYEADESGKYDPQDPVDYLLFVYLWVPLLQDSLDKWIHNYNSYKRRIDKKSMLPSGCSANVCYKNPEDYDAEDGLVPVELSAVLELENEFYPDAEDLLRTCPEWFREMMDLLITKMELDFPKIDTQNDWSTLSLLRTSINLYDSAWIEDPTNDPSETIAAHANLLYDLVSTP
ncbi:hypothetical protein PTTG_04400 [Puccinia triticina 1-1 BBBD Race 1]|uniref:Integrase core domain-containing protein n=1 Tax=Puccinia triticina (isolate 1-1 / race 1 (BBBD)) TaxID=630390 RepID=A0A180GM97_PUCT1|nr:hypothetical protein PTTG_04400 [Puccinia triticina 1-1 BBBD Race 1]